jgi:hypothetical protein
MKNIVNVQQRLKQLTRCNHESLDAFILLLLIRHMWKYEKKGLSESEPKTVVERSMMDELSHKSHRSKQNFGEIN